MFKLEKKTWLKENMLSQHRFTTFLTSNPHSFVEKRQQISLTALLVLVLVLDGVQIRQQIHHEGAGASSN